MPGASRKPGGVSAAACAPGPTRQAARTPALLLLCQSARRMNNHRLLRTARGCPARATGRDLCSCLSLSALQHITGPAAARSA